MTTSLAQRVHYRRHENGTDMYLLKTAVSDVVTCLMAFPGGTLSIYEKQTVAALLGELLPGATKKKTRSTILEQLETLGAQVSVRSDTGYLTVTLAARKVVFEEALKIVLQVLTVPVFGSGAFHEAQVGLETALHHAREDTRAQAHIAFTRALYRKGHPHWSATTQAALRELSTVTAAEVLAFHRKTLSSVGALVCIVGDIVPTRLMATLERELTALPSKKPTLRAVVHVDRLAVAKEKDIIVSLHDKMNVDMLLAMPLALTREHSEYHALATGVQILGGSMTSRLFHTLRTEMSLTYGSYAALSGFSDGYPGHLLTAAIFPQDVFARAQKEMRKVVRTFVEKGVTARELRERKEEVEGKYKVGLSTTAGTCGALFATLLSGRSVSYIDEYPDLLHALTLREVNTSIKNHLNYDLAVSASAGAIDKKGAPLT